MLVFISGAVRSGKSSLGEKLAISLAGENRKIYLATSRHYDAEMSERIRIHQQTRAGKGFLTIDKCSDIGDVVALLITADTVMLDCLGTLLANEMFNGQEKPAKPELIRDKILADLSKIRNKVTNLIIISNEVFADGVLYEQPTETYIKTLAKLHIELARASDTAIECIYSRYLCHKGSI